MKTNLMKLQELLGFTGGTVSQMSDITGLTVSEILTLDQPPLVLDYKAKTTGSVMFTCSGSWIIDNKSYEYYGNLTFWHTAIKNLYMKVYI